MNRHLNFSATACLLRLSLLVVSLQVWEWPLPAQTPPGQPATPTAAGVKPGSPEASRFMVLFQELNSRRAHDAAWFRKNITEAGHGAPERSALLMMLQNYYHNTNRELEAYKVIEAWQKELNPGEPLMIMAPRQPVVALPTLTPVKAAALPLKQFKQLALPVIPDLELSNVSTLRAFYRGNRLWIEARCIKEPHQNFPRPNYAVLYGLDLAKDEQDVILFEPAWPGLPCAEVSDDMIFIQSKDKLKTYNLRTKAQRDFPLVADDNASLVALEDKLFLVSTNSLTYLDWRTGSSLLMASNRRRPPQTPLDELASLHPALLLPGLGGALCFQAGPAIYTYDQSRKWSQSAVLEANMTPVQAISVPHSEGRPSGLITATETHQNFMGGAVKLYGVSRDTMKPQLLVGALPGRLPGMAAVSPTPSSLPVWAGAPMGISGKASYVWMRKDLVGTAYRPDGNLHEHAGLRLAYYQDEPKGIISLTGDLAGASDDAKNFLTPNRSVFKDYQLATVPGGLIALLIEGHGYWFIPQEDLKQAVQSAK